MTTTTRTGRLFVTTSQARSAARTLRSAVGIITAHNGAVSPIEAIYTAAQHITPTTAAETAMHARSALVGWLGLDLAAHDGYTVPALQAWRAGPTGRVDALNGAADQLLATIEVYVAVTA